jgi:hypothetical protein
MSAIITPIKATDIDELRKRAALDNHGVWYPTHLIKKDGEISGYVSVCTTPIVNVWLDSKKLVARDSVQLLNTLENVMRMTGRQDYVMPCSPDSPFFPNMQRLGYSVMGENVWFHKDLNKE